MDDRLVVNCPIHPDRVRRSTRCWQRQKSRQLGCWWLNNVPRVGLAYTHNKYNLFVDNFTHRIQNQKDNIVQFSFFLMKLKQSYGLYRLQFLLIAKSWASSHLSLASKFLTASKSDISSLLLVLISHWLILSWPLFKTFCKITSPRDWAQLL